MWLSGVGNDATVIYLQYVNHQHDLKINEINGQCWTIDVKIGVIWEYKIGGTDRKHGIWAIHRINGIGK